MRRTNILGTESSPTFKPPCSVTRAEASLSRRSSCWDINEPQWRHMEWNQLPVFRQIGRFHWEPFAVRLHEAVVHSADAHTAQGQPGAQPWPWAGSGVPPRPLRCPHRLWQNFPNTHLVLVTLIPQQLLPFTPVLFQRPQCARRDPTSPSPALHQEACPRRRAARPSRPHPGTVSELAGRRGRSLGRAGGAKGLTRSAGSIVCFLFH